MTENKVTTEEKVVKEPVADVYTIVFFAPRPVAELEEIFDKGEDYQDFASKVSGREYISFLYKRMASNIANSGKPMSYWKDYWKEEYQDYAPEPKKEVCSYAWYVAGDRFAAESEAKRLARWTDGSEKIFITKGIELCDVIIKWFEEDGDGLFVEDIAPLGALLSGKPELLYSSGDY